MSPNISRALIDALFPKGSIWNPADDDGLDLFLDGSADNWELVKVELAKLANIRNADLTTYLEDMEREYGFIPNTSLTEAERRARLKTAILNNQGFGTAWDMQAKLRAAGFTNIFVYQNDPPVDVNDFIDILSAFECGDTNVESGAPAVEFSFAGGELVVNGQIYFNGARVFYTVPANDEYWDNFFFVGGTATFTGTIEPLFWCGGTLAEFGAQGMECGATQTLSEITAIELIDISISRQEELRRLIVKYKPIHSWGILLANWTL